MKKLQVVAVVMVLLIAGSASAQTTKIGYIRIDDIVGLMPELKGVVMDTVGNQYLRDSLGPKVDATKAEYDRKLKEYEDTIKNSKAVREQLAKDLQGLSDELNSVQSVVQQVRQYESQKFLAPYYKKAKNAIDAVAKRRGYTHVVSTDVFLIAPPSDDLSLDVLAELKIQLPKQNPPPAPKKPTTGGAKPPVKKNN
jgi:outer membrane protein